MSAVIFADIRRVMRKKSFIIMLILECLLIVGFTAAIIAGIDSLNAQVSVEEQISIEPNVAFVSFTVMMIGGVGPLLLGLPIFLAVFSDDFRSHALQMAIGSGLSRKKLILARFTETVILTIVITVFMFIAAFISGLIQGMDMQIIGEACVKSLIDMITMVCYLAICLIPVYGTQNTTLGMILYILLEAGVVGTVLNALRSGIPQIKDIHIEWLLPDKLINDVAMSGDYSWGWVVWIIVPVVYIAIPVWVAMILFRKKELEF